MRTVARIVAAAVREAWRFLTLSPRSRLHELAAIGARAELRMAGEASGDTPPASGRGRR